MVSKFCHLVQLATFHQIKNAFQKIPDLHDTDCEAKTFLTVFIFLSWLKQYGIHTECEAKLRSQQKAVINDNIIAEYLPFTFPDEVNGGFVVKNAACVAVRSLHDKVIQQLQENEE